MKHTMPILLGLLICCGYGCQKEPYLGPTETELKQMDLFEDEAAFDQAALGIYQKLIFFYNFRQGGERWLHDIRLLPDDDATTLGSNPFEYFGSLDPLNADLDAYYRFAYQLIARANTLLEKQDEVGDLAYEDEQLRATHRGEALFLRGYMFFMLWNVYGTAPVVTERILSQEDFYPPNAEGTELLDQAIADFGAAAELLPAAWPTEMLGRATRQAAYAFGGKALLFRATVNGAQADYLATLDALEQVQGASLLPVFGDNFDEALEEGAESIFEVHLGANTSSCNCIWINNDAFESGDLSGYWGFFDNHFSLFGIPPYLATQALMAAFEPGDPRISDTYDPATHAIKKYVTRPRVDGNATFYYNNARIMRYADVLLMRAEALVQSGGDLSEAVGLLNELRTRARNSVSPAAEVPADLDAGQADRGQVMQWVMAERRRELAFEEHRWYDLRRWHLGGLIDLDTLDFSPARQGLAFEAGVHLYFPLPASQVSGSPTLTQNPGY